MGRGQMPEPLSTDIQQANSPARQLLLALNRASQEMEKSVSESFEHVGSLNADLEHLVNSQLEESTERVENFLRAHLDSVSSEKDTVLSQLAELRQEELKVLQSTGKNLRQVLADKLEVLIKDFKTGVDNHLQSFRSRLDESDLGHESDVENTRRALRESMPGYLSAITEQVAGERQSLEQKHADFQKTLADESNVSLDNLDKHCANLKARLESDGQEFFQAVEGSVDKLVGEQKERLAQRIESFSLIEQKAGQRIESLSEPDKNYIKELPANFQESCQEMANLQVGLHATLVKNLALQYRTEILSAAQEAEDQLQIVRTDLQSLLRQYQNQYSERFESLLAKYEKSAGDLAAANASPEAEQGDHSEIIEKINEKFADLKKSIAESARNKVANTESAMEKAYEDFRIKLEYASKNSCEKIEENFKESKEELSRLQQSNEEHLKELTKKMEELEQSVNEARELIRVLDVTGLDF